MKNKELFIFDLDGTLTESKSNLTQEVASVFSELLYKRKIAVISGCSFCQIEKQFFNPLIDLSYLTLSHTKNLYLLPTSGASMYDCTNGLRCEYNNNLNLREKVNIYNAWDSSTIDSDFKCSPYGEIVEDRGAQVTFSMCGQDAPLDIKKDYDPDGGIRSNIVIAMHKYLIPDAFELKIGGTTSIDVTRKGIDKAYGVIEILKRLCINKEEALFIGDSLYVGGNDSVVKDMGVDCIETTGPKDTIHIIESIIGGY